MRHFEAVSASGSQNILERVQACLHNSSYRVLRNVSCEWGGGVLTLRGKLPSFFHKQLAQEEVARLDTGLQIVNELEVIC